MVWEVEDGMEAMVDDEPCYAGTFAAIQSLVCFWEVEEVMEAMADEPCYAGTFAIQSLVCFCFLYTCRQKSLHLSLSEHEQLNSELICLESDMFCHQKSLYLSLSEHDQLNSELSCLESDVVCLFCLSVVEWFSDCHYEAFAIHSLVCSCFLCVCRLKSLYLSFSEHDQLNSELSCLESDMMCLRSILCLSAGECLSDAEDFAMHSLVCS